MIQDRTLLCTSRRQLVCIARYVTHHESMSADIDLKVHTRCICVCTAMKYGEGRFQVLGIVCGQGGVLLVELVSCAKYCHFYMCRFLHMGHSVVVGRTLWYALRCQHRRGLRWATMKQRAVHNVERDFRIFSREKWRQALTQAVCQSTNTTLRRSAVSTRRPQTHPCPFASLPSCIEGSN